jgi:tetratricopeptide (TPR) repeat protein
LFSGRLGEARSKFERLRQHYVAPANQRHKILFHFEQRPVVLAKLARALLLQGFIDQAKELAQRSFEETHASDEGTQCWALYYAMCPVALLTGDVLLAERGIAIMRELGARLDATLWRIVGACWEGKLAIARGEYAAATSILRKTLDTCALTGWQISNAEFLGDLAQGLIGLGQPQEALPTLDQALARAGSAGEEWYAPELLRLKGNALLALSSNGDTAIAEEAYREAIGLARDQGALFWELRSALSLARLLAFRGQPQAARAELASVYNRFIEGLDTADLRAARSFL